MTGVPHPVLEVEHLSKRYARDLRRSQRYALHDIGRELLRRPAPDRPRPGEFAAVDDLSFTVSPGEALAVVGRNGAGKSTLLKLLAGLIKPDAGSVTIRGRLGALIELGTGFDPILTGRENIAVNAAVLGLHADEVAEATEQVIDFAELQDAADAPVRSYSTGMSARLAFAVAAHMRPDLLLVDEVLAVGDFSFQRKCVRHMRRYLDDGGALVLVSHNGFLVQSLCTRGLLLEAGRSAFVGTAVQTVGRYLETADAPKPEGHTGTTWAPEREESFRAGDIEIRGPGGAAPATGEPVSIRLPYRASEPVDILWGFGFWTGDDWVAVGGEFTSQSRRISGIGVLAASIPRLTLQPGTYLVRAVITEAETRLPITARAWSSDRPAVCVVQAPPGHASNAARILNQLVTIDVDWH